MQHCFEATNLDLDITIHFSFTVGVGCVPSAAVTVVGGVPARGYVPARGVYLPRRVYLPGGCTCPGGGVCVSQHALRLTPPREQND